MSEPQARPPVLAAVDIGSNSIKMTVARHDPDTGLTEIGWASETVRLGAGLDRTGSLADDRIEAALVVLARFAAEARAHGAERVLAVATEAVRAAANGARFIERVRRETAIEARVIDGDEEAALTFRGLAAGHDVSGEVVVADIGGASTELIVATAGEVRGARSLPVGSGRLTDRLVATDPPTAAELAACREAARTALAAPESGLELAADSALRLLVVGGTGEYLARLAGGGARLDGARIEAVLDRLRRTTATELATELSVAEARARVLPAGVAVVAALADRLRPTAIEVARSGIRTGVLMAAFASGAPGRQPAEEWSG